MESLSILEKKRNDTSVLGRNLGRKSRKKKEETVLPKLKAAPTSPTRITENLTTKFSEDFSLLREKCPQRRPPKLLKSLPGHKQKIESLATPSRSSSSNSDIYSSDYDESQYSEITEFSEIDSVFLETLSKEVSKRVISGMVLTTKCGEKAQNISEKSLGKRVERFLGRPVQVPVISSQRPPRVLTPLPSPRQQRGDTWCQKQQKISKVFSNTLRAVYNKSSEGKCRYMRAPLTPIPPIDWIFENGGKVERILSATNS
jgi:hypothetical protein